MALIVWNEGRYGVNIKEIDNQHKQLVDVINLLQSAMSEGKGKQVLGEILGDMAQYAKGHFATEEKIMKTNGYSGYDDQKKEHDAFVAKAVALKTDFDGGRITLSVDTLTFLKNWLDGHIANEDQKYSSFLNAKGVV
ncbi:hypothetical protein MNBD_DELTA01-120 [hydrothermal vent metagenome]|uniref:Hemerythrin-like domain-containing protein n=1 Tax=hydrothermal vent metagenome TaxID=652676 RepID=A0A3B0RJI9_9ZZZZ